MSDWTEYRLADCIKLQSGGTPSKSRAEFWGGSIPWVSAKDMKTFWVEDSEDHLTDLGARHATRVVPPGSTMLLTRGMTLHRDVPVCRVRKASAFNQDVKAVIAKGPLRADLAPHLLVALKPKLLAAVDSAGHGTGRLSTDRLLSVRVALPIDAVQREIAHFADALEGKVALNEHLNGTLQQIAQAIYQAWFIDFLPVRAKATARAEGRDPLRAAMCALSGKDEAALDAMPREHYEQLAATAALFPDEMVESQLGQVPLGWGVDALMNHIDVERGLSYQGSGLADAGLPLHNLNSINEGGGYKFDGMKFYTGKYRDRHVLKPGDVVVANTEQGHHHLLVGYAAVIPKSFGESGLFSQHLYRVRLKHRSCLRPVFIAYLLNSRRMHSVVSGYANGTTVNMLPESALQHPTFAVPPAPLIQLFEDFAQNYLQSQEVRVAESRTLTELRDKLLPKLLSGEIPLGKAQELAEAAA